MWLEGLTVPPLWFTIDKQSGYGKWDDVIIRLLSVELKSFG